MSSAIELAAGGVHLAILEGFDRDGAPLVGVDGHPPVRALVLAGVRAGDLRASLDLGSPLVVALAGGDPAQPIVLGVAQAAATPDDEPVRAASAPHPETATPSPDTVIADGEAQVISAERELILRCGRASITLTREGKVVISGTYISSRSSGTHRITGGSVQIN